MIKVVYIFLSFVLTLICTWAIFTLADAAKLPSTPCFYLGSTEMLQPAKPCIDIISWQTYQLLGFIFVVTLTWGWYKLIKKYLWKDKISKKKSKHA